MLSDFVTLSIDFLINAHDVSLDGVREGSRHVMYIIRKNKRNLPRRDDHTSRSHHYHQVLARNSP